MKTLIKSSAFVLALALLSTAVFANDNEKKETIVSPQKAVVLFTSISQQDCGVGVIIRNANTAKSAVTIYNAAGKVILADAVKGDVVLKGYLLSNLDNGEYTIKVTTNLNEVSRKVQIYTDENDQKAFFFEL